MRGGVGCVGVGAVWEKLGEGEDDVMVGMCVKMELCEGRVGMCRGRRGLGGIGVMLRRC